MPTNAAPFDVAIIGGGVNGCGIARDAAGRGANVLLIEQHDLASGTSSRSTKLIHGGLRYLEHFDFKLVRESLKERETLWRIAPHIIKPLRFVLPHRADQRARWLLRTGLWIYDHLGGRQLLPGTRAIKLHNHPTGAPLKRGFATGWEYSDCWVDDARLVVLNARDAADRGATILTHHRMIAATRIGDRWQIDVARSDGSRETFRARALVNAAGPAIQGVLDLAALPAVHRVSKIRGAHIVVPRQFIHRSAYIFQLADHRVLFAIPYERDFTLIGTTEGSHEGRLDRIEATPDEIAYLCRGANEYFLRPISPSDVVWSFAGVRALVDANSGRVEGASRGYRIEVDAPEAGAPMLSVYGGKITTYRSLAQDAVDRLAAHVNSLDKLHWTASAALPGGDFAVGGFGALTRSLSARYPFLRVDEARRIAGAYGTRAPSWLGNARTRSDLGEDFGNGLSAAEVDYCMAREWARTVDDMLWRRTKLGLRMSVAGRRRLQQYMMGRMAAYGPQT
jgi:glycerol-3-phosphate dehydrogenase